MSSDQKTVIDMGLETQAARDFVGQMLKKTSPSLARDLIEMPKAEKPFCTYMGNGVRITLTSAALLVEELDERMKTVRAWVETQRVNYTADTHELDRLQDFRSLVDWEVRLLESLEMDEDSHESYYRNREERIRTAYAQMVAELRLEMLDPTEGVPF